MVRHYDDAALFDVNEQRRRREGFSYGDVVWSLLKRAIGSFMKASSIFNYRVKGV